MTCRIRCRGVGGASRARPDGGASHLRQHDGRCRPPEHRRERDSADFPPTHRPSRAIATDHGGGRGDTRGQPQEVDGRAHGHVRRRNDDRVGPQRAKPPDGAKAQARDGQAYGALFDDLRDASREQFLVELWRGKGDDLYAWMIALHARQGGLELRHPAAAEHEHAPPGWRIGHVSGGSRNDRNVWTAPWLTVTPVQAVAVTLVASRRSVHCCPRTPCWRLSAIASGNFAWTCAPRSRVPPTT